MAQRALSEQSITCVICLDLLTEPVTLPCGHSYCMHCIKDHWDKQEVFSCPQCRQSFNPRPVLVKSTMLASLVEELKKAGLAVRPDDCYAGPGDVSCDVCPGRKMRAVNSCLQCLVSYCATHLQPHCDVAMLKTHQLVEPSDKLHENLCMQHYKPMDIFCCSDQRVICYLCSVDQHKGHDMVMAAAERAQRKSELPTRRALLLQSLETDMMRLQQEAQDITRSAQRAMQRRANVFREIALHLEIRRSEVEQQILSEEKTQLRRVQELQDQLQQSITGLKRGISELDTLPLTPDHNQFIHLCPSPSTNTLTNSARIQTRVQHYFEDVFSGVSALRDKFQLILSQFKLPQPEPFSRGDFLRCACEVTLDTNTANPQLNLSEVNTRATFLREAQSYPDQV